MTTDPLRSMVPFVALLGLIGPAALPASPADAGHTLRVVPSISIESGDWIPLSREDMGRAASDTALARLTDTGRLDLLDPDGGSTGNGALGTLALEITLIGPAETAKLTITLAVEGSPTLVSTASISVHALDHAGIFDALEHVGEQAAERLATKLELLQNPRLANGARRAAQSDDPTRKKVYDEGQAAKRDGRYEAARAAFETVVESAAHADEPLAQLARDELRYGLPLFEAQQALNQLGQLVLPGQRSKRNDALSRAENLFRQIQAENPSNVQRVSEAQRYLDQLLVTRGAMANAMRANMLSRLSSVRMMVMEYSMTEGRCPASEDLYRMMSDMNARIVLDGIQNEGGRAKRYHFSDPDSPALAALRCDDRGVEFVGSGDSRVGPPAAPR